MSKFKQRNRQNVSHESGINQFSTPAIMKNYMHRELTKRFGEFYVIEIAALILVIMWAFVYPLICIKPYYMYLIWYKTLYLYKAVPIMAGCLLALYLGKWILSKSYKPFFASGWKEKLSICKNKIGETFNIVDAALLTYYAFVVLSTLLSEDRSLALTGYDDRNEGLIIQTIYVAIYFLISIPLRMCKRGMALFYSGGTLVAILCLLHVMDVDFFHVYYMNTNDFVGPMGNVDFTSYYLTLSLVVAAAVFITEQTDTFDPHGYYTLCFFALLLWSQMIINVDAGMVAMAAVLLVSLPLLLTSMRRVERFLIILSVGMMVGMIKQISVFSNGTMGMGKKSWAFLILSLICAGVALAIEKGWISADVSRKTLLIATLSIDGVAVLGALTVGFIAARDPSNGTLYEFGQMLFYHNFDDHFGTLRVFIWKGALKLISEHPFFGTGPQSFVGRFNYLYHEKIEEYYGTYVYVGEAHNEYLELWVNSGIFALGGFLSFLGLMIAKGIRRAEKEPLLLCGALGVLCYSVQAFFGLAMPVHTPMMWLFLGIAGAAIRTSDQQARLKNSAPADSAGCDESIGTDSDNSETDAYEDTDSETGDEASETASDENDDMDEEDEDEEDEEMSEWLSDTLEKLYHSQ
ncbi:MAG: O-antigen ligase family protein [Clostridia bacterium]|nr:O-antigen ligase family protein [Clostridia bacterium]